MVVEVKQGGGEKKGQAKKRGLWKPEEDLVLRNYVEAHGEGNWATVSAKSGLKRGGKSCRLRWKNYLRPNIKRGEMSEQEQDLIVRMHKLVGNRWSLIAGRLPGRTDNEVKNYWNTHMNKPLGRGGSSKKRSNAKKLPRSKGPLAINPAVVSIGEQSNQAVMAAAADATNAWIEAAQNMNYYIDTPVPAEASDMAFVSDMEPFMAYFDPFLFSQTLEFSGEAPFAINHAFI
ncbi:unnamed protein product [Linum trigynum]|uniref:Uncharacterized protein n=1 Tax=Linum trigynum TaxID=586398 RepID=A0AAV2CSQ2_9ROSI